MHTCQSFRNLCNLKLRSSDSSERPRVLALQSNRGNQRAYGTSSESAFDRARVDVAKKPW